MAKAKSGGTRALIRGRVAQDVYSVGKDGDGKRQQIVRSAPVEVSNPKTRSQVEQRIKMKAVTRMLSLVKGIVDHSWEGVPYGQQSVSEFIKRSLAAINNWVAGGHTPETYLFLGENDEGVAAGVYPLSAGSLQIPSNVLTLPVSFFQSGTPTWVNEQLIANQEGYGILVLLPDATITEGESRTITLGEVRTALGLAEGDYMTYCVLGKDIDGKMAFMYERFYFKGGDDTTVVNRNNINTFFETEGTMNPYVSIQGISAGTSAKSAILLGFDMTTDWFTSGVNIAATIVSRKLANGQWGRSTSALQIGKLSQTDIANQLGDFYLENGGSMWDDVFDEWTIGASRFLNGGNVRQ